MRRLQTLAASCFHANKHLSSVVVGPTRPLASPGAAAAASRAAGASTPAALPWAWASSGAGLSTGSASSSGGHGSFAAWGAAWRSALGAGGGGVAHIPAGQQIGGVRGLGGTGSFGLQPTACRSTPTGATSLGSCNTLSGPGAAAWRWSGALGSRTGAGSQPGGGAGGVRPVAPGTVRGGPMGMAAAGQLSRGMSHSSSGAGGSWRTLAEAISVPTQAVLGIGAVIAAVVSYTWYKDLEQVPYSGRWRSMQPTVAERLQLAGPMVHEADTAAYRSKGELLPDDHPDVLLVRRLGAAVVEAAVKGLGDGAAAERLRGLQWEFCVVDDGQGPSVSARPGGKVVVRVSMLDGTFRDEDLLAFVLAHEVAHEVAQHEAESECNVDNAWAAMHIINVLNLALAATLWISVPSLMAIVAHHLYASKGVWNFLRPLSKWYMEFEADAIAMQLIARAGFNPGAGVVYHSVVDNFVSCAVSEAESDRYLLPKVLLELTRTHPSWESRMQRAWQQLPAACRTYTEAGFGTCDPEESFRQVYERSFIDRMERPN